MGRVARGLALLVVLSGCGRPITSREARARLRPDLPPAAAGGAVTPSALALAAAQLPEPRRQIVEAALAHAGMPASTLDCSALAQRVYATMGVDLPRTTSQQLEAGTAVEPTALQPGDLVFFSFATLPADHVGIFAGGDAFVHVSTSQRSVRIDRLGQESFARAFVAARRYVP